MTTQDTDNINQLTYPGFVGGLLKPGQDILSSLTPEKCHMLHMAIGLARESVEFLQYNSDENFIEEAGDIEFFAQGMLTNRYDLGPAWFSHDYMSHKFIPITNEIELYERLSAIVINAHEILETIKKWVIYNKPLQTGPIVMSLSAIHHLLESLYVYKGVTRVQILDANRAKLDKRYKDGYSDKAAQERADKAEGE